MNSFFLRLALAASAANAEILSSDIANANANANAEILSSSNGEAGASVSSSIYLQSMEAVFMRSFETHTQSMSSMMKSMSVSQAMDLLSKSNMTTAELMQIGNMALGKKGHLRATPAKQAGVPVDPYSGRLSTLPAGKGYSGLDNARKLLNDMIYEAEMKYDEEIHACTDFYSTKCAALEAGQSDLLASNFLAASSRTLMSAATTTIERCKDELEETEKNLHDHLEECAKQRKALTDRLEIVLGDIEVLTTILEMTDCGKNKTKTALVQMKRCENSCKDKGHPGTVMFASTELQEKVDNLKSKLSKDLFQDTMADLFGGIQGMQEAESLIQTGNSSADAKYAAKTPLVSHPVPKMGKLGACDDPYKGGPSPQKCKGGPCCTIGDQECPKLQGRFLRIQAGVVDEKEELEERLAKLNHKCAEVKEMLETKISELHDTKSAAEGDLDDATKREAKSTQDSITTTEYNTELNADVKKTMTVCRSNYLKLEGEICALRKIRGELYKMKGDGHPGFFEDCAMGKWVEESCTKKCGGGEQNLTRAITSAANGGAKCLPTRQLKSCNNQACPIDCVQEPWSGWSKCSAECGGGVESRVRRTTTPMRYGGSPCGDTKQEVQCNTQACDKDCELSEWTKWSKCSKDCGGGSKKRIRYVKSAATGAGKCANKWSKERLEYTKCAMNRCVTTAGYKTKACLHKPIDVILLLDGSGSMGTKGWAAQKQLSKTFIQAFDTPFGVDAQIALILYSGPSSWSGWKKCFAKKTPKDERDKACNVRTVSHYTKDMKGLEAKLAGLSWPKGGTLTSLALKKAQNELVLGRAGRRANVVLITDGRPTSSRWTQQASFSIRKHARLLWVPITRALSRSTMKRIKRWATKRWQENVFPVRTFDDLKKQQVALVTNIIGSICPGPQEGLDWSKRTNKQCAVEGGSCECNGTVVYGKRFTSGRPGRGRERTLDQLKADKFKQKTVAGSIKCSNRVFGDPTPGFFKQCICVK